MLSVKAYRYLRDKYRARQPAPSEQPPQTQVETGAEVNTLPAHSPQQEVKQEVEPPLIQPAQPPQAKDHSDLKYKIFLLIGLAIPVFLETLDYTVVATAQVHIASVFNRLDLQSYIGTVYLLTSTVFLPLFASISDVFGRHTSLQVSLLLFMVGSAISTGSQNMPTMLAGRGVAGIGAAGLLAAVRIILTDSRSLDDNNWQQSILFVLYTIGYCLGPFIGGELVSVSFRWIFAINLPFSAVASVVAFFLLRKRVRGSRTEDTQSSDSDAQPKKLSLLEKFLSIDWIGALIFMAGGILILLALNWGSTEKWNDAKVIACFVVGGVLIIIFLAWQYLLERKANALLTSTSSLTSVFYVEPMIPLSIFRSIDVCIVQYATFVSGVIMLVMFYFVAIFMTIVTGLSPTKAGVQLIYFAPGMGGGAIIAIYLVKFLREPKYPIVLGQIIGTVALGLIAMAMQHNNQAQINGFMAFSGVGVGLSLGPLAIHARFSQPESRVAIVSALSLFFRSFGGTVGLAQCGAVLNGKVNAYITGLIKSGAISGATAQAIANASSSESLSSIQSINSLPPEIQTVIQDAFRNGTKWCFISLVPWSGLACILCLFLSNIQKKAELLEHGDPAGSAAAGVSNKGDSTKDVLVSSEKV